MKEGAAVQSACDLGEGYSGAVESTADALTGLWCYTAKSKTAATPCQGLINDGKAKFAENVKYDVLGRGKERQKNEASFEIDRC
eukprot:475419-Rhodomonas_salina.1